jgi:hypothetical protein
MTHERRHHAAPARTTRSSISFVGKGKALPRAAEVELRRLGSLVERDGPLPPEQTVSIVRKAARSLADAPAPARRAGARSHVYWLGAALYFALTGTAPVSGLPRSPSLFSPHRVPSALDAVVKMCLAKERADQFSSPQEVAAALSALSFKTPGANWG